MKCGAMAEDKAVKLSRECNGRPKREAGGKSRWGGAWGQLNKLLSGKHPCTNAELPPPKRRGGTLWTPNVGEYRELKNRNGEVTDDKFYWYEPAVPEVKQQIVKVAAEHIRSRKKRRKDVIASENGKLRHSGQIASIIRSGKDW